VNIGGDNMSINFLVIFWSMLAKNSRKAESKKKLHGGKKMLKFGFYIICSLNLIANCIFAMDTHTSSSNPSEDYKMHICAFHIAKDNPKVVIETQHYCTALSEGIFQCILYETTEGKKPKLLGVEYVISNDLYQKLSLEEKKLWHPHDYEVRQGLLALVDASKKEDEDTMKVLVTTWGKTWHTWPDPETELPLGFPRLMWSAEKEGDVPQSMIDKRDKRWNMNTEQTKKDRAQYLNNIKP
jgi:hypothetical protein